MGLDLPLCLLYVMQIAAQSQRIIMMWRSWTLFMCHRIRGFHHDVIRRVFIKSFIHPLAEGLAHQLIDHRPISHSNHDD